MFCEFCGNKINNGDLFCLQCGTIVATPPQAPQQVQQTAPQSHNQNPPAYPQPPYQQDPYAGQQQPQQAYRQNPYAQQSPQQTYQPDPYAQQPQQQAYQPDPYAQPPQAAYPQMADEQPKKKKSGGKRTFVIILVLLLLAGAIAGGWYFYPMLNPAGQIITCLENKEYDKAVELYYENFYGKDETALVKKLEARIAAIKDDYINGKIDYDTVYTELEAIHGMNIFALSQTLIDAAQTLESINGSRSAFTEGEALFTEGKYKEAMEKYGLVTEDDQNYTLAQAGKASAAAKYKEAVFAQVDEAILKDDFETALNLLSEVQQFIEDDTTIHDKIAETKTAYAESAEKTVQDLIAGGKQDEAVIILEKAARLMPENEKITALLGSTQTKLPVGLHTLTATNTTNYEQQDSMSAKDGKGNTYAAGNLFKIAYKDKKEGSVEYKLASGYKNLSGKIALDESSGSMPVKIIILADDKEVYTSDALTKDSSVLSISINLENVKQLKIKCVKADSKDTDAVVTALLSEFVLTRV